MPVARSQENVFTLGDRDRDPGVPGPVHVVGYVLLDLRRIELGGRCLRRLRRQQDRGNRQGRSD